METKFKIMINGMVVGEVLNLEFNESNESNESNELVPNHEAKPTHEDDQEPLRFTDGNREWALYGWHITSHHVDYNDDSIQIVELSLEDGFDKKIDL